MPTRGGFWVFQDQYDFLTAYLCDPEFYLLLGIAVSAYMAWGSDISRRHVRTNQALTQKVNKVKVFSLIVFTVLALMFLHGRSFPDKKAVMNCQEWWPLGTSMLFDEFKWPDATSSDRGSTAAFDQVAKDG
ncbi:hypothetical protein FNYG_09880 [Fusarium nygamai]|uniref:Uncharacterized protein n=1 Tax=Gibberella nygamai TaxID=42673 RepID=A0A2K0W3B9_GIBNY|nr:hypothetical protein FNYG_09880 [Fusarium nygamai]